MNRCIGGAEFVIPLRLTNFDAPFLIVHAQYIDFKRGRTDARAELLATLEDAGRVPRKRDSVSETMGYRKQAHLRHDRSLTPTPEPLVTNRLSIEQLPETLYLYDGGISYGRAKRQTNSASRPIVPFRRGFLAFCPLHDLQDHFGPSLSLKIVDRISTNAFLHDAWPDQRMERFDARNQFANLVRQAMEFALRLPPVAVNAPVSILFGDAAEEEFDRRGRPGRGR